MDEIKLQSTPNSPFVDFKNNGMLVLKGRAFPENAKEFFDRLIAFIKNLETNSAILDMDLEYFNTASAKKILELMKSIDSNTKIANVQINWRYEEGDDDNFETAESFEEALSRSEFRYIEYSEATT